MQGKCCGFNEDGFQGRHEKGQLKWQRHTAHGTRRTAPRTAPYRYGALVTLKSLGTTDYLYEGRRGSTLGAVVVRWPFAPAPWPTRLLSILSICTQRPWQMIKNYISVKHLPR
jgi:hypothetical protein